MTEAGAPVAESVVQSLEPVTGGPRETTVLVLLSGGLDSSALLAHVLEHTDHAVHAHHVALHNPHGRGEAEEVATDAVVRWCRAHRRDFEFSQSVHRFMLPTGGGWDTTLFLFAAARVCVALQGRVDLVATGHIRPAYLHLLEAEAVFHAGMTNEREQATWVRPFTHLRGTMGEAKAAIETAVPAELVELTWWCRVPIASDGGWEVCGRCHACRNMAAARETRPRSAPAGNETIP